MKTTLFKTIALGGIKPKLKNVEVTSYAKDLLKKIVYQKEKEEVDLVVLTPSDLGFTSYPSTTELFARAKESGYDLCPAEVGPRLREIYADQPNGEGLYIGMERITASDGHPDVFAVERYSDGEQWLYAHWAFPDDQWGLGCRIVFRLRKSSGLEIQSSEQNSDALNLELRVSNLEKQVEKLTNWAKQLAPPEL